MTLIFWAPLLMYLSLPLIFTSRTWVKSFWIPVSFIQSVCPSLVCLFLIVSCQKAMTDECFLPFSYNRVCWIPKDTVLSYTAAELVDTESGWVSMQPCIVFWNLLVSSTLDFDLSDRSITDCLLLYEDLCFRGPIALPEICLP